MLPQTYTRAGVRTLLLALAILGLALLLAGLHVEGAALADHPVQPVAFNYERIQTIDPGESWIDGKGLHIRNRIDLGLMSGDISGTAQVVYNADVWHGHGGAELPLEKGLAYGTFTLFSDEIGEDAPEWAWQGEWHYRLISGRVSSGSLAGVSGDGALILVVDQVREVHGGLIAHGGFIDHVFCPDLDCDPPPED